MRGLALWLGLTVAGHAAAEPAPPPAKPVHDGDTEFNIVPLIGGNSDVGFGLGQTSNLAGLAPDVQPYRWSLETSAFITFKSRDGLVVPFQDYFVYLHLRDLGTRGLRLDLRASFTAESTLLFYGIGNDSPDRPSTTPKSDLEYERIHPTVLAQLRVPLGHGLFFTTGNVLTYNRLDVAPDSLLARYATTGPADGRTHITSFDAHAVELVEVGMQYDTRDREIDTRRGQFDTVVLRVSPRLGSFLPYSYQRLTVTGRSYVPLSRRITLAFRVVGDALFGDPPFYELARYEETQAIGGANAVRGVPAGRYYGRVKLFGNAEARADLFGFHIGKKALKLGVAGFFDAGRTWTELFHAHPDLDGSGVGLKYGVGGGLRLRQGATFVVRADVAYSPDAEPIGAYFTAGQIF